MEKIMSKTNDISNIATLDNHHTLADSELDVVFGGTSNSDWSSWIRPLVPPVPYPGGNPSSK
jgi:hypothetical protein